MTVATQILIGLPYELQFLIWKKVILINLTTEKLCELIHSNDTLDGVITTILVENDFEMDLFKGVRMLPHNQNEVILPFIPLKSIQVHPFMPFQSEQFRKLAKFMMIRHIRANKVTFDVREYASMPPPVDFLHDFLHSCFSQVHIIQQPRIRTGTASDIITTTTQEHTTYLTEATSCLIFDYYDCYDYLKEMDRLTEMDILWYDEYPERVECTEALISWAERECVSGDRKKLIISLILSDEPADYLLDLLKLLSKCDIELNINSYSSDQDLLSLLSVFNRKISVLEYYINKSDTTFSDKCISAINNMTKLKDLQLRWSKDCLTDDITIQNQALRHLELFGLNAFLSQCITINSPNIRSLVLSNCELPSSIGNRIPASIEELTIWSCSFDCNEIQLPPNIIKYTFGTAYESRLIPRIGNEAELDWLLQVDVNFEFDSRGPRKDFQTAKTLSDFIESLPESIIKFKFRWDLISVKSEKYDHYFNLLNFNRLTNLRDFTIESDYIILPSLDFEIFPKTIEKLSLQIGIQKYKNRLPLNLKYFAINLYYYSNTFEFFWKEFVIGNNLDLRTLTIGINSIKLYELKCLGIKNLRSFDFMGG